MIETKISGPKCICHPNGMVLKVLNQKLCPQKQSTSSSSSSMKMEMETAKATRCKTIIRVLNQLTSSSVAVATATATSLVKMEMETDKNGAEQRIRQLKRVKQRAKQHYSHVHHWPPQQQYKSKIGLLSSSSN